MNKNLLIVISFITLFNSCSSDSREDIIVVPQEKRVYNFKYDNSYKTHDIVFYKGPKGVKQNPKEDFIGKIWNTYNQSPYDRLKVDLQKKLIRLDFDSNFLEHKIEVSNDSIYIGENKVFIAILDKKNERLELFKSFYYIQKALPEQGGISYRRSTELGKIQFKDVFFPNSFSSPAEMINDNDEVFWANLSYSYK